MKLVGPTMGWSTNHKPSLASLKAHFGKLLNYQTSPLFETKPTLLLEVKSCYVFFFLQLKFTYAWCLNSHDCWLNHLFFASERAHHFMGEIPAASCQDQCNFGQGRGRWFHHGHGVHCAGRLRDLAPDGLWPVFFTWEINGNQLEMGHRCPKFPLVGWWK